MAGKTTATQGSQGASSFPSRLRNARSAKQEAAGKLRARAIAGRRSPKAAGKEASGRQQALGKQFSNAAGQQNGVKVDEMTSVPTEASVFDPQQAPSTSAAPSAGSPEGETGQSISPMAEKVEMVPSSSEGLGLQIPAPPGKAGPLGPEATFTPTAAGLRPPEAQEIALSEQMQLLISQAVAQVVASTLHQRARPESTASEVPSHSNASYLSQAEADTYQGPVSQFNSSMSRTSFTGDEEQRELGLSEDEDLPPDPPAFTGLFNPDLFKSLLQKATSTAQLGPEGVPEAEPSTSQGPTGCSEATFTQQDIPCPSFFLSEVQKQWGTPGNFSVPGKTIKNLFNVAPALSDVLAVPMVDEPLATTFVPNFTSSGDIADFLTLEDKRAEYNFRKTHQASAWAVKAAISISFFARISVLWLRQLQAKVPPEEVWMHQDLNKLVAASEYMADSSLQAARFSSRALASNVSSRRLLWLRQWKADVKSKWRLASSPYRGGQLFGEALTPYLTEKDKRKVMSSLTRRADTRATPYAHKQFFRPTNTGSEFNHYSRPHPPSSTNTGSEFTHYSPPHPPRPEPQFDRSGNRGRPRQQFQAKQPFRGARGHPFRRS
ncbi:lamina-associated polypeptide 2-like [Crotalus tigris]|uniref:lamina-associated polypeptide 2-like n=1 Tax=Crotalus tigris TaxID=88082 RepID=UPI00192F7437|nr:lamina-associated polypeptide 2-like [Crotalus tigris]